MSVLKRLVDVNRHAVTLMARSSVVAIWDTHWMPMELTAMVQSYRRDMLSHYCSTCRY